MHFGAQRWTISEGLTLGAELAGLASYTTVGMSATELSQVVNFNAAPAAPSGTSVLLLYDVLNAGSLALEAALQAAGITVTRSAVGQSAYDGTNPAPDAFNAVVHLVAGSWSSNMPVAGQNALVTYVQNGGGFLGSEWLGYGVYSGYYLNMTDLVLFTATASNGIGAPSCWSMSQGRKPIPSWRTWRRG